MPDDWIDGRPSHEAYGRVTNPGRFAVLHVAADALAAELAAQFVVTTAADVDVPSDLAGRFPDVRRTLRLDPGTDGAPVTFVFTGFPGLAVRYGRWCTGVLPMCGCDACDDDPSDLVAQLTARVWSVAREGFHESRAFRRGGIEDSFRFGSERSSGWAPIDDDAERRRLEAAGTGSVDWPPWRPRPTA